MAARCGRDAALYTSPSLTTWWAFSALTVSALTCARDSVGLKTLRGHVPLE
jgi:hypothetical protein